MDGRIATIGTSEKVLTEGWNLVLSEPDAYQLPSDVPAPSQFIPAFVPGTVAEALERAGLFDRERPLPLHGQDAWYFCRLFDEAAGEAILRLNGLATICDVFLNGERILSSTSMFEAHDVDISLRGGDELALCFRALEPRFTQSGPRARWRPRLVNAQGLRFHRTTLLGHMPGWCPDIHAVGPWRSISVIRKGEFSIRDLSLQARLDDRGGVVMGSLVVEGKVGTIVLRCGDIEQAFIQNAGGQFTCILRMRDAEPWWPHTHGDPRLYDVSLVVDGVTYPIGRTGFRLIDIDRGDDGRDFKILVNGERVFCRGSNWTNADIVRLPGGEPDYAKFLRLAVQAGMNMIRIGGTMAYETEAFFRLCDELGILVWQDAMLSNFDYPATDKTLHQHIETEIRQLLQATRLSPSLAVVCGGNEMYQQAAMYGLPKQFWSSPITETVIPAVVSAVRQDIGYVVNSPSGGPVPFAANESVTHYYGVGAYLRPLDDIRRADVRFAAESLAFAHVPQERTVDLHMRGMLPNSVLWKSRVPHDAGTTWDFEDIRDHYLNLFYGFDAATLRREDTEFYLDLSRAVTGEIIEAAYAEWRRKGSSCNGALTWTYQDFLPGAGWGAVDSSGEPKPVWYGMRRAFRPIQLILTDEGTNGLYAHIVNERAEALELELDLVCLRDGKYPVVQGRRDLTVAGRTTEAVAATDLFGAFFDTTYAFRFGPPSHDITVGRLRERGSGRLIAEAFHFPIGRKSAFHPATLTINTRQEGEDWFLDLETDLLAQSVHILSDSHRAEDDWFHLAPGWRRGVRLLPREGVSPETAPSGSVRTLGSRRVFEIGNPA